MQPRRNAEAWYDPGADAAERFSDWVIRHRRIHPIPEVLCIRRRVILLERAQGYPARRCALAHALAHLDLGHVPGASLEPAMELEADQLASRRLVRWAALMDAARWSLDDEEAASELGVTVPMLRVRFVHLHPSERAKFREVIRDVHHA